MNKSLAAIALFVLSASPLLCQEEGLKNILAPGAELEKLADGFLFTEGPTADNSGNVYFTDQPNDRIMIWNEKSGISVFLQPSGRSNGLALDRQGSIWSCADEKNEILKISPDKKIEKITNNGTKKIQTDNSRNQVENW